MPCLNVANLCKNISSCFHFVCASSTVVFLKPIVPCGTSWATLYKSVDKTVPILGYPPVVCLSAIKMMGCPPFGICIPPNGTASDHISALCFSVIFSSECRRYRSEEHTSELQSRF